MVHKKIFIDTNIWIYAYDESSAFFPECRRLLEKILLDASVNIYTSCDAITNIYYILAKNNKASALMDIGQINQLCHIIEFGNLEVAQTVKLMQNDTDYVDLEDTIQYILAKKAGCDVIISNDKNFTAKGIPLLSSGEFLA